MRGPATILCVPGLAWADRCFRPLPSPFDWPSLSRWDEPGKGVKVPKNPPASGKLNGGFSDFNDEMLPPSSARAHSVLPVVDFELKGLA